MYNKICGYNLDNEQIKIVHDESKYLIVVAGAGSGKTLTILGKINFLINYKKLNENEILCISFTRKSSDNLRNKILKEFNINIPVYTFHKLALEILKENNIKFEITTSDMLDNIIHEFIYITVLNNEKHMELILKYFKVRYKNRKEYIKFLDNNNSRILVFEKLISTFLHHFKCNGYTIDYFKIFLKKSRKNIMRYFNEKIFFIIAFNIYLIYEKYLEENSEMDFDDIIIMASDLIEEKGMIKKYKYIIIDEYQDTSYIRFKLIKNIIDKIDASLMVVGDDFQSIYGFTGCDVSLFLDFHKYFENAKIMKIQNTYRNSNELITVAGKFVMRDKQQIKKELHSYKHLSYPIRLVYYKNIKDTFRKLVLKIYEENKDRKILVLGRNNKDINKVLDNKYFKVKNNIITYIKNENIKIEYLTIHKSKGLESDNVIIINLENSYLSLPNKIENDKVLRYVSLQHEKIKFSEERRLFYVALTRTKNYVYLLIPYKNESIFVSEIKKYSKYCIKEII